MKTLILIGERIGQPCSQNDENTSISCSRKRHRQRHRLSTRGSNVITTMGFQTSLALLCLLFLSKLHNSQCVSVSENHRGRLDTQVIDHRQIQRRNNRYRRQTRRLSRRQQQYQKQQQQQKNRQTQLVSLPKDHIENKMPEGIATSSTSNAMHQLVAQTSKPKLTAILHVGPMKTGTTSIQNVLHMFEKTLEQKDNYEIGLRVLVKELKCRTPSCLLACFRPPPEILDNDNTTDRHHHYKQSADWLKNQICQEGAIEKFQNIALVRQRNFIFSSEGLHSRLNDIKIIYDFVQVWDTVRIVMYYRRYYDWYLSFYNQGQKDKPIEKRIPIDVYVTNDYKNSVQRQHPSNADRQHLFTTAYDHYYIIGVLRRYQEYFPEESIHVYNMHNLDPYTTIPESFLCDAIPNATHTCTEYENSVLLHTTQHIENSTKHIHHQHAIHIKNMRRPLVYEHLAYYAHKVQLWSEDDIHKQTTIAVANNLTATTEKGTKKSIESVANAIRYRQEMVYNLTEYDYAPYLICPNATIYEYILQKSHDAEALLFPEFYNEYGKDEINEEFDEKLKNQYCHVDAEQVIQNDVDGWKTYLDSI